MNIENLTATQLRKAADLQEEIQKLQSELSDILGGQSPAPVSVTKPGKRGPKKGGISAEGRARIAAAQKARWAKAKGKKTEVKAEPKTGKRTMSAAAKLAISKAAKARWAKVRAAKKA